MTINGRTFCDGRLLSSFCIWVALVLINIGIHLDPVQAQVLTQISAKEILQKTHTHWKTDEHKKESIQLQKTQFSDQISLPNPELSIGFGRSNYGDGKYDEVIIRQPFKINGIYGNLKKQRSVNVELAQVQSDIFKLNLSTEALQAAYKFKHQIEMRTHVQERIDAMNVIVRFIKAKKFFTPKSKLELQLLQNQIDYLNVDIIEIQQQLDQSRSVFEDYVGDSVDSKTQILMPWLTTEKLNQLQDEVSKSSKLVTKVFDRTLQAKKLNQKQMSRSWIPDLGIYYSQTHENFTGGNLIQTIGINMQVPIFNQGLNKAKNARADLEIEKLNRMYEKKYIHINTNTQLTDFKTAIENLNTYNLDLIKQKDTNFKNVVNDFKKGLVDALSYINLEEQNHTAHRIYLDNRLKSHIAILEYTKLNSSEIDLLKWFN